MSRIALSPNASGTGTLTIAAPNTNADRTLTLPDATGTVNISGLANQVPAGSAGAPAIYPTGDTNTGVFFPAADTVAVATAGTERMRVNSSGNVGIGTTSPSVRLQVTTVGTSDVPMPSGTVLRVEQGPFGPSETVLQIAAESQTYGSAAIYFGVRTSAGSTRIVSGGPSNGLLIQENSGGPITLMTSGGQAVLTSTGNLQFNSGYGSAATAYGCRAWVNFNGSGTVAIRASGNVSSITDNGTGDYTVNFTTAMPDANYCFTGTATYLTGTNSTSMAVVSGRSGFPPTTSALRIMTLFANGNPIDCDIVNVAIFR